MRATAYVCTLLSLCGLVLLPSSSTAACKGNRISIDGGCVDPMSCQTGQDTECPGELICERVTKKCVLPHSAPVSPTGSSLSSTHPTAKATLVPASGTPSTNPQHSGVADVSKQPASSGSGNDADAGTKTDTK